MEAATQPAFLMPMIMRLQDHASRPIVTDVVLELHEAGDEMHGSFQWASDMFSRASAERLASSFQVSFYMSGEGSTWDLMSCRLNLTLACRGCSCWGFVLHIYKCSSAQASSELLRKKV